MAVSTELTVQQREVIFEEMDEVTQIAATEGTKKLQAGFQVSLLIRYDLGNIIDTIFRAEHLNESQQKQEIKKLAAYWNQPNLGPSTLYDHRNVAVAFDRDFIKEQVEERLSDGGFLTWSHFKELQKIGGDNNRTAAECQLATLKLTRKHSWSSNDLALELQGKKESSIKRTGGRKPMLPKTPNAMLQKLFASIQQSDNYVQAVNEPLDGIFMEMPVADVNEQFVENIDNALARIVEASSHYKETEKRLKKVRTRAAKVLKGTLSDAAKKAKVEAEDKTEEPDEVESAKPVAGKKKADTKKTDHDAKGVKRKMPRRAGKEDDTDDILAAAE